LAISESSFGEALTLSRWLAADARAERSGATANKRRRGKTALIEEFLSPHQYGFQATSRAKDNLFRDQVALCSSSSEASDQSPSSSGAKAQRIPSFTPD
jgi:hypothetical protein